MEFCEVKMESVSDSEREETINTVKQLQSNEYIPVHNSSKIQQEKNHGKVFSCDQCEFTGSQSGVFHHKNSKHEGIKYQCDQCDYAATLRSHLQRHKKSKHDGVRYPCDQCKHSATTPSDLTRHKKSKHEGVRFTCDQCDYAAARKSRLKLHIYSKHVAIKNISEKNLLERTNATYENIVITPDLLDIKQEPGKKFCEFKFLHFYKS